MLKIKRSDQRSSRGQSAIEFVIIFGFVLFAFVTFFVIIKENQLEKEKEKERILLQNIALDVQSELGLASGATNGYNRIFQVPLKVLGNDYNIEISSGLVYVSTDRHGMAYRVPEIIGNVQKGSNSIKKENDTVYLNQ